MPLIQTLEPTHNLQQVQQSSPEDFPFLLQSSATGPHARYDILFAYPQQSLIKHANGLLQTPDGLAVDESEFLKALDSWFDTEQQSAAESEATKTDLPFSGGWFVYLGYELAQEIEPSLPEVKGERHLPIAMAVRIPAAIVYDHELNKYTAFSESQQDLDRLITQWQQTPLSESSAQRFQSQNISEGTETEYLNQVEKIKHYIKEGDVFQVNLSRPWIARFDQPVSSTALYQQLMQANPAPFAGNMLLPDIAVLSSSPERLVKVKNSRVETRPIAGTRPRDREDAQSDLAKKQQLVEHPKERAEHVMLIDLERNDLGRICKPGSVKVDELMAVESYAHVHHIVSNVIGELEAGVTPGDVIRAVFPGGTITGCPKVRCMEILTELEQTPREAYTGSMGYLNLDGSLDLNILIRTMMLTKDQASFRAGGGIVYDSHPDKELMETRAKARGLLRAVT